MTRIISRGWRVAKGGLILCSLVVYASCVNGGYLQKRTDGEKALELRNCQFSELPSRMKEQLSGQSSLCLDKIPEPTTSPLGRDKEWAAPCVNISHLTLTEHHGSPRTLEWIKFLFPNITALEMDIKALPIQTDADAEESLRKGIKMEGVAQLFLRNDADAKECPIFENLKLFPRLKFLSFEFIPATIMEDERGNNLMLRSVEFIAASSPPVSRSFMKFLPTAFPLLKTLSLSEDSFQNMTSEMQTSVAIPVYDCLEKLIVVSPRHVQVIFGEKMADIFPSVSKLEIISPLRLYPPLNRKKTRPLHALESVKVSNGCLEHIPEFFSWLFPNLESLVLRECELSAFSKRALVSRGHSFFHPHLRRLDISRNPMLTYITEEMLEDELRFPAPSSRVCSDFQEGEGAVGVQTALAGGLHLPELEALDVRGSLLNKIPLHFFLGCPKIRRLKVTFDIHVGYNGPEWWECLKALSSLTMLDVDVGPWISSIKHYNLSPEQGFSGSTPEDIVKDLTNTLTEVGLSLSTRPMIRLFKQGSREILSLVKYPRQSMSVDKGEQQ